MIVNPLLDRPTLRADARGTDFDVTVLNAARTLQLHLCASIECEAKIANEKMRAVQSDNVWD
jgi:hypothetical protein